MSKEFPRTNTKDEYEDYIEEQKIIKHFLRIIDKTTKRYKRNNQKWRNMCILNNKYYLEDGDEYELIDTISRDSDIDYSQLKFTDQLEDDALAYALDMLTPREYDYIYMKYVENFNRNQIAHGIGLKNNNSLSNFQKNIFRKIRKYMLKEYCNEEE